MIKPKTCMRCIMLVACSMLISLYLTACDLINPTKVDNPQTTEESLAQGGTGATQPFLNGLRDRYSDATEDIAYFTDTVSDNYDNVATFISPLADLPASLIPQDLTLNDEGGPYFEVQELRALADFAITGVIPNDPEATNEDLTEAKFYRAMANVLSAENFGAVPVVEDGPLVAQNDLLQLAITDLTEALAMSQNPEFAVRVHIVLARIYRSLGNADSAESEANLALNSGSPNFVFPAEYDAENNENACYTFAVSRNLNDVQPLPRLDFLDPKYVIEDAPIASIKMEEAHLILAEVELSRGNLVAAAGHLGDVIDLAKTRPVASFMDPDPRPNNETGTFRPQTGTVQASGSAPAIGGLIVARQGNEVLVPTVSGTSLDAATVRALTDGVELLRTLYLARQEIFFFEGRRMNDLGIRIPMMEREIETNNNISPGDPGTQPAVPSYIPTEDEMDAFTFDSSNTVILHDMNQILADNRVSPFGMPF